MAFAQVPSLIEVTEENFEPYFQSDFKNVLSYASYGVDTIVLATGGFVYTTKDTTPMVIKDKVVIMAAEGLDEKPILTHPNTGFASGEPNSAMEIFRLLNDVEFHGVAFRGDLEETGGCKYALRYGDWTDPITGNTVYGKTSARFVFKDCDFIGFHSLKDQSLQGNVLYYLRPDDTKLDHLRNTKVFFENCYFKDIGDEAIRISENEKYGGVNGVVAVDTLIVKNCTFEDIDAECIRVYGDLDTSNTEGYLLASHVTVVKSAPRFIYAKNFKKAIVQDVLISHGRETSINRPDRGDYNIQVQLKGSYVSHIDTFENVFTLAYEPRIGATKGGYVDVETIYGYDPEFADVENGDYTILKSSPLYYLSSDGTCIGDLRWATNKPVNVQDPKTPSVFALNQNYPNPFNPKTTFSFTLPENGQTTLKIFNVLGQLVYMPVNGYVYAGQHEVRFDASFLPSGVYFYELRQGEYSDMKKMVLIK
ncbi:MAG: T9SS type A sorting domain-containing protein [Candidatus Marinimicrobia bacterium]|nr:T9SS type A sorting domain-containing protein [Candidatus Neomarinimicrobiota bacterium]